LPAKKMRHLVGTPVQLSVCEAKVTAGHGDGLGIALYLPLEKLVRAGVGQIGAGVVPLVQNSIALAIGHSGNKNYCRFIAAGGLHAVAGSGIVVFVLRNLREHRTQPIDHFTSRSSYSPPRTGHGSGQENPGP